MTVWEVLGIPPTSNESEIKKAYAKQMKKHHPETDPEGFKNVYNAYKRALQMAKTSHPSGKQESPLPHNVLADIEYQRKPKADEATKDLQNLIESQAGFDNNVNQFFQDESLFSHLIDYANEEKKEYYQTPALVEFIRLFSNQDKVHYWETWQRYFESTTFLKAQYDKKFIQYLANYLEEQQFFNVKELPRSLFCELCISYGIMTEDEVYKEEYVKPLIDILSQHHLRINYVSELCALTNLLERRYAYYIYRSVLMESEKNRTDQTVHDWICILEDCTNEYSKKVYNLIELVMDNYVKHIRVIPLVFELITNFFEMNQSITKEMHYAFYQLFEKKAIKNDSEELKIMLLTLQEMRSLEIQQYITQEEIKKYSNEIETYINPDKIECLDANIHKGLSVYLYLFICFLWIIPPGVTIIILGLIDLNIPNSLFSIIQTIVLESLLFYLLCNKVPSWCSRGVFQTFIEEEFNLSYYIYYKREYWMIDENNGQVGIIFKKYPFKVQLFDALHLDEVKVCSNHNDLNARIIEIGVHITMFGNRYTAYTYRSKKRSNSEAIQAAYERANELVMHLLKAKEISLKQRIKLMQHS